MNIGKDEFLRVSERLYDSEEYNKHISVVAFTKNKKLFAENLLAALKIEQSAFKEIQQ